jgi:DNA (cytosine-5)-methyltransferase 1
MSSRLTVISLFSGALGLDLGLEQAGFEIRVAVECNHQAAETIRRNRPKVAVIERKLEEVTTKEILERAGLKPGEPMVITGGPSCQPFSTVGQRGSMSDPRGTMFREFLRVVREAKPEFFVMENVRGVISAAIRHRPLRERGPGFPPLQPDEELGSAFLLLLKEVANIDYSTAFDLVNAADYGVPQVRERLLFIGSRDGRGVKLPKKSHGEEAVDGFASWISLRDCLNGLEDSQPSFVPFSPMKRKYLSMVPEGGNWRDLPTRHQRKAMGGAFDSWGGRVGFYRRLDWERPTPALTTEPTSKATMLCHPDELRPLTVREYARIQQFPDSWEIVGSVRQRYIQLGNAVPVGLGRAIGKELKAARRRKPRSDRLGTVSCLDPRLLERIAARPKTILNPARMRKLKDPETAKKWLGEGPPQRSLVLDLVVGHSHDIKANGSKRDTKASPSGRDVKRRRQEATR